jgi:prepilin signal peptidase PulO-like enzyme (type II secretory pathway)
MTGCEDIGFEPDRATPRLDGLCLAGGLAAGVFSFALLPSPDGVFALLFAALTAWVVRSDIRDFIIPDTASAGLAALGLFRTWVCAPDAERVEATIAALTCGLCALALMAALQTAYRLWRGHEGLGLGDVKLAGACAVWLDPAAAATTLEIAALAGLLILLVVGWRRGGLEEGQPLPFGAVLAPAAFLVFCAGGAPA